MCVGQPATISFLSHPPHRSARPSDRGHNATQGGSPKPLPPRVLIGDTRPEAAFFPCPVSSVAQQPVKFFLKCTCVSASARQSRAQCCAREFWSTWRRADIFLKPADVKGKVVVVVVASLLAWGEHSPPSLLPSLPPPYLSSPRLPPA